MAKLSKQNLVDVNTKYDDLTAIKGIREARQQWFRDTMKVYIYHDLAVLTIDQIEMGLKAEKQFPSRSTIAGWIAQAKVLAETAVDYGVSSKGEVTAVSHWKSLASFVIEFQEVENKDGSREQRMNVHHIEADKNRIWWAIEPQECLDWILAEAGIETKSAVAQPAGGSAMPISNYPTGYSDQLQQVLAKTQQLSRTPPPN
jgi:hypothetical protein